MNQRPTRKEMKRDDLVMALERSRSFVEENVRILILAAVGVVVAVLLGAGVWWWLEVQEARANEALGEALEVMRAPVGDEAQAAEPGDLTFPDAAARTARAEELFTELRSSYRFSDPADVATVYLGQIAAERGDLDRARELWREFVDDHDDHLLADQVRINVLRADRQAGAGEQVLAELSAMLDAAPQSRPLPGDVILAELARTYEELDRSDEARARWRQLADEYPASPYVSEARQAAGPAPTTGAAGAAPSPFTP